MFISWLKKVVELFRLFFVNQLHRYDGRDQWPCVDLLQQFLIFTDNLVNNNFFASVNNYFFKFLYIRRFFLLKSSLDLFLQSLEAWNVFLDYLSAKTESKTEEERLRSVQ